MHELARSICMLALFAIPPWSFFVLSSYDVFSVLCFVLASLILSTYLPDQESIDQDVGWLLKAVRPFSNVFSRAHSDYLIT